MSDTPDTAAELLSLTAEIVSAHVASNSVATGELGGLITSVHAALVSLGSPAVVREPEERKPAVAVRSSIKHDHLVCLEDGAKLKMLKRYLQTNFQLSPAAYRAKWKLPADYPMVAPAYAEQRRALAKEIGLGRKGRTAKAGSPTKGAVASQGAAKPKAAPASKRTLKAKFKQA